MKYRAMRFTKPEGLAAHVSPLNRGRPVDLVFLAKLSKGDSKLELEYLSMFDVQLQASLADLSDLQEHDAAQCSLIGLKGAARNVGAFGVADFCARALDVLGTDREAYDEIIDDLKIASAELTAFVVNMVTG